MTHGERAVSIELGYQGLLMGERIKALSGHVIGLRDCQAGWCRAGAAAPCECGGVIHANPENLLDLADYGPPCFYSHQAMGPRMFTICDRCASPEIDWLVLDDEAQGRPARDWSNGCTKCGWGSK